MRHNRRRDAEGWMSANWRPLSGFVYLIICLSDFLLMPIWHQWYNTLLTPDAIIDAAVRLQGATVQIEAIRLLRQYQVWEPVTMSGAGMFHVAFGAILSAAAWTRGQEKIEALRAGVAPNQPAPGTTGRGD
jgi:hypothetical protein